MASSQAFKIAVRTAATVAIYRSLIYDETVSPINRVITDYATIYAYRADVREKAVPSNFGFRYLIQPGNKILQMQMNVAFQNKTTDSNIASFVCDVTFLVHRYLMDDTEEALYTDQEMLADQEALLTHSTWLDISPKVVDVLLEGPSIVSQAERVGQIISYQVDMQCQVIPN